MTHRAAPLTNASQFMDNRGNIKIRRIGGPSRDIGDVYHVLLGLPWWAILIVMAVCFCFISYVFAVLYWLGGDCIQGARAGHVIDYFYFSVQTLATIGYGGMTPRGDYANALVCVEAFIGMICFAVMTGLIFSKFSIPHSRVIFSHQATVSNKDGRPALTFRLANARGNQVIETRVNLTMIRIETTAEGETLRRLHRLPLAASETPVFALTFTGTHYIDEGSPLHGLKAADLEASKTEFVVTVMGTDATIGQAVHARHSYSYNEIVWGHRLADTLSVGSDGRPVLDFRKFHDVIPWELKM